MDFDRGVRCDIQKYCAPSSLNCRFNSDDKTIVTAIDSMSGATCVVPVLTKHDLNSNDVKVEMSINLADWVEIGTVCILPAITIASISSHGPLLGGQPVLLTGTGMKRITRTQAFIVYVANLMGSYQAMQ